MGIRKDKTRPVTDGMRRYAYEISKARINNENVTEAILAKRINMSTDIAYSWRHKFDWFDEWLEEEVGHYMQPVHDMLTNIALHKMRQDYRYWEAIAKSTKFIDATQKIEIEQKGMTQGLTKEEALKMLEERRKLSVIKEKYKNEQEEIVIESKEVSKEDKEWSSEVGVESKTKGSTNSSIGSVETIEVSEE